VGGRGGAGGTRGGGGKAGARGPSGGGGGLVSLNQRWWGGKLFSKGPIWGGVKFFFFNHIFLEKLFYLEVFFVGRAPRALRRLKKNWPQGGLFGGTNFFFSGGEIFGSMGEKKHKNKKP